MWACLLAQTQVCCIYHITAHTHTHTHAHTHSLSLTLSLSRALSLTQVLDDDAFAARLMEQTLAMRAALAEALAACTTATVLPSATNFVAIRCVPAVLHAGCRCAWNHQSPDTL